MMGRQWSVNILNKSTKEIYNYAQDLENRIVYLRGLLKIFYDNGLVDLEEKRFYTDISLDEFAELEKELDEKGGV